jgi:hypothetical protein
MLQGQAGMFILAEKNESAALDGTASIALPRA